jgi:hypothetical protein
MKGALKMRSNLKIMAIALMAFSIIATSALARGQKDGGSRGRGIELEDYEKGRVDGMLVLIKKYEGEQLTPVLASQVFRAGDRIKVEFESNFDGYVYVLNVAPSGKTCILFPNVRESNNLVHARQRYTVPTLTSLRFDEEKGDEVLQVYMSRQPIKLFDDARKSALEQELKKACLSESVTSAASELSNSSTKKSREPGIDTDVISPLLQQKGSRSRGIELIDGSKQEKGSVVAVNPNKEGQKQLRDKDFAVYEIRLRHQ